MRHSLLQRLAGLFLLVAHTITGTSALPAFTALAADLEGSHEVVVSHDEHGTQVVLHHQGHEFTPEVGDHKHALARILVRLCRPSPEGDHKLSSEALTSGLTEEEEKQVRAKKAAPPDLFLASCSCPPLASRQVQGHRADTARVDGTTQQSVQAMLRSVCLMV